MADVNWTSTQNLWNEKSPLVSSRNDWLGFLDTLGWVENEREYSGDANADTIKDIHSILPFHS